MLQSYKTAAGGAVYEFIEKKSRFIAHLEVVDSYDNVRAFIERISLKYKDATHNCYGARLRNPRIERFSDDGEPTGTAGMPILDILKKEDVFDTAVIVTRYFGGTLLGAGGLVRAYTNAAACVLHKAQIATRYKSAQLQIKIPYHAYDKVCRLILGYQVILLDTMFEKDVTIHLKIAGHQLGALGEQLQQLLAGKAQISVVGEGFACFK